MRTTLGMGPRYLEISFGNETEGMGMRRSTFLVHTPRSWCTNQTTLWKWHHKLLSV